MFGRFTILHFKDGAYVRLIQFIIYLKESGTELKECWERTQNGIGTADTQLCNFLFECAILYLRALQSKEPKKYSADLVMFEAKDKQWLYYTRVITHALHQIYRKTNTAFNAESCEYAFTDLVSIDLRNEINNWTVCVSMQCMNASVCVCFRVRQE